jgi:3-oxoacyl-[acyl-carrier protein] reductase
LIAKHLAAGGAAVVVNYASSKEGADSEALLRSPYSPSGILRQALPKRRADRVIDEIASAGGKAVALQADVTKRAEVEQLFAKTQQVFGRLDILVNNAGI